MTGGKHESITVMRWRMSAFLNKQALVSHDVNRRQPTHSMHVNYLVYPGQWMHHHRPLGQDLHDVCVDDVSASCLFIVLWPILKPLFLNACLVQDVHVCRNLLQALSFLPVNPSADHLSLTGWPNSLRQPSSSCNSCLRKLCWTLRCSSDLCMWSTKRMA